MVRKLDVFYTSDCHGNFEALSRCSAGFAHSGNALIIDGGDLLHGSPLAYYLNRKTNGSLTPSQSVPAELLNAAGYHFITLGNHDFSFGVDALNGFLSRLRACCLCANLEGLPGTGKTAVVTLANGLRVGVAGITSSRVPRMEPPEHLNGLTVTDAFTAAKEAYETLLDGQPDLTVCVYHGGFEIPPEEYARRSKESGFRLPDTPEAENQGFRIAEELGFDLLLTAHQHQLLSGMDVRGTTVCQLADGCSGYLRLTVELTECKKITCSFISTDELTPQNADLSKPPYRISVIDESGALNGSKPSRTPEELLEPIRSEFSCWLESPAGQLDRDLPPLPHLTAAVNGSLLANFFNQVQLEATGADISCTSLGNTPVGIPSEVTNGDVIRAYSYANTLAVVEADRELLRLALERSAEYFESCDASDLCSALPSVKISDSFLKPMIQHFNYDYYSGIDYVIDTGRPIGDRVTSIKYMGEELEPDRKLKLCLNNYRLSGNGGYPFFREAKVVSVLSTDVQELIFDYIAGNSPVAVDSHRWATVL